MNDSHITVPTPLWLQRRMLRNLQQVTKNRVNSIRVQKAEDILAMLRHKDEKVHLHSTAFPVTQQMDFNDSKSLRHSVRDKALRMLRYVKAVFSRCLKHVFALLKQASLPQQAHGEYVANEKEVQQNKDDDTATTDALIALGQEDTSGKEVAVTDDTKKTQRLARRIEHFLEKACEAEAKEDFYRAARLFTFALFCEGKLRPDVKNPHAYIFQAMPVY